MYMRDGLYLSGKGGAVFADEHSAAVDSGMGSMTYFLWQTLYKQEAQGSYSEVSQIGQEAITTLKPVIKCPENKLVINAYV